MKNIIEKEYPEFWNGLTICGTPEHPCPNGWTRPHYPLGSTSPEAKLKINPKQDNVSKM